MNLFLFYQPLYNIKKDRYFILRWWKGVEGIVFDFMLNQRNTKALNGGLASCIHVFMKSVTSCLPSNFICLILEGSRFILLYCALDSVTVELKKKGVWKLQLVASLCVNVFEKVLFLNNILNFWFIMARNKVL